MNNFSEKQARLVFVGATGMVGGYALRYALDHFIVGQVTTFGRRRLGISHPKLREIVHQDFADCSLLADELSGQNAAVFCLGTYTGAVSDRELRTITVDYTVEFARVLRASSPDAAFSFLSGSGADPTGRSRMAFARYKGGAENALLAAGFPCVYIFRPAYIYPVKPRKEPNFSYRLLRRVYPAFRTLSLIGRFEPMIWLGSWWMRLFMEQDRKRALFSKIVRSDPWSTHCIVQPCNLGVKSRRLSLTGPKSPSNRRQESSRAIGIGNTIEAPRATPPHGTTTLATAGKLCIGAMATSSSFNSRQTSKTKSFRHFPIPAMSFGKRCYGLTAPAAAKSRTNSISSFSFKSETVQKVIPASDQ